jgi:hypothetical protein
MTLTKVASGTLLAKCCFQKGGQIKVSGSEAHSIENAVQGLQDLNFEGVQFKGSFSERVGNLFLSISQKYGEGELFGSKIELKTIRTKCQKSNDLGDVEAIAAFNNLLGFIKETNLSFNIVEIHTSTTPEGRNAALSAVIKEFEENNIYPLGFGKSQISFFSK